MILVNSKSNSLRPRVHRLSSLRRALGRSNRRLRGFTVIEMIVATVLLAIGVVASLTAISSATKTTKVADDYTTATLLAQQQLATIETQLESLTGGTQNGDFGDNYRGFKWEQNTETTDYPNLYRVTLTVNWGQGAKPNSLQIVTYEIAQQQTTTSGATGTGGQ